MSSAAKKAKAISAVKFKGLESKKDPKGGGGGTWGGMKRV
jgi:hypothetical protein